MAICKTYKVCDKLKKKMFAKFGPKYNKFELFDFQIKGMINLQDALEAHSWQINHRCCAKITPALLSQSCYVSARKTAKTKESIKENCLTQMQRFRMAQKPWRQFQR